MIIQITYFIVSFIHLWEANEYSITRSRFSFGFPIARASANLISLNSAVAILVICRNLITFLRSFSILNRIIPFDAHLEMHLVSVAAIIFWSALHVSGHAFNYSKISQWAGITWWDLLFKMPTGLTGVVLGLILAIMVLFSLPVVRAKYFHIFSHIHLIFIFFIGYSSLHGAFCFIKNDAEIGTYLEKGNSDFFSNNSICNKSPSYWKWVVGPFMIYIGEKILRLVRGSRKVEIRKVIQHPSNTIEIQVSKVGNLKAGQYAFISCPEIGFNEWHPFTASSSPLDPYLSFHIRAVGDWTTKFAKRLGCDLEGGRRTISRKDVLPSIKIDGFYGAPAEDVFNYDVCILIGAGIGVTPFASILKEIWNRRKNGDLNIPKKIYFFWIAKDTQCFEWFQSLLMGLEEDGVGELLEIHIYLTQHLKLNEIRNITLNRDRERDVITGLGSRTQFGRPKMDDHFTKISRNHPGTDVGVFCCGPKPLSDSIERCCSKFTHSVTHGVRFHFGKENF